MDTHPGLAARERLKMRSVLVGAEREGTTHGARISINVLVNARTHVRLKT